MFAIVLPECVECIAQGHVTDVTPYCTIVTSSSKGSLLDASKIIERIIIITKIIEHISNDRRGIDKYNRTD